MVSRMRERRAELDSFSATLRGLSPDLLPPGKEEMLLWALEVASSRAIGETASNGTAATMVSPLYRPRGASRGSTLGGGESAAGVY
jgi:hypothetical protein